MIDACRNGEIDMIITKSISRFARNTVTLLETIRELKSIGVNVYFEEQNIYTLSGDGELMVTILVSYAQEESLSASENQKWRIRKNFKQGKVVNLRSQYGYYITKDDIKINPETGKIVEEIFDRVIAGESYSSIARDLNRRGVVRTFGGKWTCERISSMIINEKYVGDVLQQKFYINNHLEKKKVKNNGELPKYYLEGTHPAIISKEKFIKAGEIYKERRTCYENSRKAPRKTNIFTGLIQCEKCGKNYQSITKYGIKAWSCSTLLRNGKGSCISKKINEDLLENIICEILDINEFSEEAVKKNVSRIVIPKPNYITFHLTDGRIIEREWKDRSRSESWTDEMRENARQAQLKGNGGKV